MIIPKSYCFEVVVGSAPSQGGKYNFPNNLGELNNATIIGIECYSVAQLIKSPLTYAPVVAAAGMLSAVLVLFDQETEHIREIPLVDLIPQLNGGLQREFVPFKINISYSYVKLVATTSITLADAFVFNIIYK